MSLTIIKDGGFANFGADGYFSLVFAALADAQELGAGLFKI